MPTLEGVEPDIAVDLEWDDYDTGLFTDKLLRHVRRGEVEFDLRARRGSPCTTYAVAVSGASTVWILRSVVRYLWRRWERKRAWSENAAPPVVSVVVRSEENEVRLESESDLERAEELVYEKARTEQRSLDEF